MCGPCWLREQQTVLPSVGETNEHTANSVVSRRVPFIPNPSSRWQAMAYTQARPTGGYLLAPSTTRYLLECSSTLLFRSIAVTLPCHQFFRFFAFSSLSLLSLSTAPATTSLARVGVHCIFFSFTSFHADGDGAHDLFQGARQIDRQL